MKKIFLFLFISASLFGFFAGQIKAEDCLWPYICPAYDTCWGNCAAYGPGYTTNCYSGGAWCCPPGSTYIDEDAGGPACCPSSFPDYCNGLCYSCGALTSYCSNTGINACCESGKSLCEPLNANGSLFCCSFGHTCTADGCVNNAPVFTFIGNKTAVIGSNLNFAVSATDADGDNLTYSASNLPSGANFNASTKTFSWTPTTAGTYDNIKFSVTDGMDFDFEYIKIMVSSATYSLLTKKSGTGSGNISVNPAGSYCGADCLKYNSITSVTLTATANQGSTFSGWANNTNLTDASPFGLTEIITNNLPNYIEGWTNAKCSGTYNYVCPTGYIRVKCEANGVPGTHGCCSYCACAHVGCQAINSSCSGTGNCILTMDSNKAAEAIFTIDLSTCQDNKCKEPTYASGCGETNVSSGGTDEACYDNIGCSGANCHCDGLGNCIATAAPCTPDWQCADWSPAESAIACGQSFSQTRTCPDRNNCGITNGQPTTLQTSTGTKCNSGTCQNGICSTVVSCNGSQIDTSNLKVYQSGDQFIAYDGLVPCGKCSLVGVDVIDGKYVAGGRDEPTQIPCQLCHLFVMIKGIIDFVVFQLVPVIAVLLLTAGGIMYLVSRGNPGTLTQAMGIIKAACIGLVIVYGSWAIVNTVFVAIDFASWTGDFQTKWFEINCAISLPNP